MVSIKRILEPEVLKSLNKGRFNGDLYGFIAASKDEYLGFCIYMLRGDCIFLKDLYLKDDSLVDGMIRAVAAFEYEKGLKKLVLEPDNAQLNAWRQYFDDLQGASIDLTELLKRC